MFNNPSALRSMDNNTLGRMGMDIDNNWSMMGNPTVGLMENSSMGLMGMDMNSSSYQTSFMENQFAAGPTGR